MKLICPICGGSASAEAWQHDAEARNFIVEVVNLPAELQKCAIAYIGLFRPEKGRGLAWGKANRLLVEFKELVATRVINWERAGEKPISAAIWKAAIEAVIERRPTQLKNHNYLKHTAYDMASKAQSSEPQPVERRNEMPGQPVPDIKTAPQQAPEILYTEEQRQNGLKRIKEITDMLGGKMTQSAPETDDQRRRRMLQQVDNGRN